MQRGRTSAAHGQSAIHLRRLALCFQRPGKPLRTERVSHCTLVERERARARARAREREQERERERERARRERDRDRDSERARQRQRDREREVP